MESDFVTLGTSSGYSLRVTADHLLPTGGPSGCPPSSVSMAGDMAFTRAKDIQLGACVNTITGKQEVVSIHLTKVEKQTMCIYEALTIVCMYKLELAFPSYINTFYLICRAQECILL